MHTSHCSRLEKPTIPLATQEDYHVYITRITYHYAYARKTRVNWKIKEDKIRRRRKGKEREGKKAKKERKKERQEKQEKTRQEGETRKEKGKKRHSFFFAYFYFPASGQAVVTGVVPSPPPILAFNCLSRIRRFSNPVARRFFIECCHLTPSRFPQVKLCTRESPHEFTRVCTRGDSSSRN